jgi:hypothetical protein
MSIISSLPAGYDKKLYAIKKPAEADLYFFADLQLQPQPQLAFFAAGLAVSALTSFFSDALVAIFET